MSRYFLCKKQIGSVPLDCKGLVWWCVSILVSLLNFHRPYRMITCGTALGLLSELTRNLSFSVTRKKLNNVSEDHAWPNLVYTLWLFQVGVIWPNHRILWNRNTAVLLYNQLSDHGERKLFAHTIDRYYNSLWCYF